MEKFITEEQWHSLTIKEKNILNKYRIDNLIDEYSESKPIWEDLNIQNMIEFLGDNLIAIDKKDEYCLIWWKGEELKDVLWEAVKYKLKN